MTTTAGNTARGFPYVGDSSVADVPAAIKALADSIELELDSDLDLGGYVDLISGLSKLARTGDVNGAKWLDMLGNFSLTWYSDNSDTTALSGVANATHKARTYRAKMQLQPDGDLLLAGEAASKGLTSPYFRAYRSSAVSYASGATVVFNSETDPNGWYNNATGIFLPTVAGMYRVSWGVLTDALGLNKHMTTRGIHSTAGTISGTQHTDDSAGVVGPVSIGFADVAFNGTTDALHVEILHDVAVPVTVSGTTSLSSHFEAERIGA